MYSRLLRNISRRSIKSRDQSNLKKSDLSLFHSKATVQKKFSFTNYCCIRHLSNEEHAVLREFLPRDPALRKEKIDEEAQKKLDHFIANNPDATRLLKIINLEIEVMRQDGERVPSQLRVRDLAEIVTLSANQRKKFLDYLFIVEKKIEKRKAEQTERRLLHEQSKVKEKYVYSPDTEIKYGIGGNSFLRRIVDTTMNKMWNWNSLKALMFGNKIVIDCSYEQYMNEKELKSCAKQMMETYSINRQHNYPYDIFLCNANTSGELFYKLHKFIPTLYDEDCPITVTSKSYLDIFEKSKLCYLTSHTTETIKNYDPETIYIIGAFVDKTVRQPISLGKAKEEGLRMAKLPIDRYRRFGGGSNKNLTINQVHAIMLDAQCCDWEEALKHVPTRKLYDYQMRNLEKAIQKSMLSSDSPLQHEQNNSYFNLESSPVLDFSYAARKKLHEEEKK